MNIEDAISSDSVIDALPIGVAVLDRGGVIAKVNAAWRSFAQENGLTWSHGGLGVDYLEVCRASAARGDALAGKVLSGLTGIMEGRRDHFELEYPCDSPQETRWFLLRASRCPVGSQTGIAVMHLDVSARRRAELALQQSEERFRLIARTASDAVWEWDARTGRVWWSDGPRTLFGITGEDGPTGQEAWADRIHPDDADRVAADFSNSLHGDRSDFVAEYRFRRSDGTYAPVLSRGFIQRDVRGVAVRALGGLTDLQEQRRTEADARHAAQMQGLIVRTQQAFAHPDLKSEDLFQLMCDRAQEMTRASGAVIEMLEGPHQSMTRFATQGHRGMIGQAVRLPHSFTGEVLRQGVALLCHDCAADPRVDPGLARLAGAAAMIATPLHQGPEVIGVLKVVSDRVGVFRDDDIAYLQMLAESLSAILHRLRTEEALARVNRAQQLLSLSNLAQARLEDEAELLLEICKLAIHPGGYRLACVVYPEALTHSPVRPAACAGRDAHEIFQRLACPYASADDPIARAIHGRQIQFIRCLAEIADPRCRQAAADEGIRSAIILPVLGAGDEPLGALCLYGAQEGGVDEDEVQMLRDLVGDLAFGLRHIRSQGDKRALEAAVLKVATGVSGGHSEAFFDQLCLSLAEALEAPASFVVRIVRHDGTPRARSLAGVVDGKSVAAFEYACAGTPCETLLDADEVVIAEGLEQRYPMEQLGFPEGRAYAGRALLDSSGRTVGLLIVMWRRPLVAIELTRNLLRIFAARAASELERRQAEIKLREQASLLDQANDAIVVHSLDGRIRYWNQGAERLYGWSATQAVGQHMGELLDETGLVQDHAMQQTLSTGAWSGAMQNRHKDGRTISTDARWTLVNDASGRPRSILTITTDISGRLKIEEQLRQSQRLEAVGQLTGGVAHDFNNLLTVILGNADLLAEELAQQPHLRELAEMVREAAQHGADLTHQLLAFSRKQTLLPRAVDIDQLVGGTMALLRRTLPESITVERKAGASGLSLVDPGQLESALLNLCLNARDAMPRGGRIRIESDDVVITAQTPAGPTGLRPGAYVRLRVIDEGCGIEPEDLARVIEPFFTTKPVGKGTGLGLSMVYGFVTQSQGNLEIESEPGKGTRISLYLPRAPDAANPPVPAPASSRGIGGSESILLVEDDSLVRRFAESQLRGLGYEVASVDDGAAALVMLSTQVKVDLLFTDIVMPGALSGPDLVEAGRRLRPGLKALYSSGYTENALEDVGPDRAAPLLRKPYRRVELAAAIRSALMERPS